MVNKAFLYFQEHTTSFKNVMALTTEIIDILEAGVISETISKENARERVERLAESTRERNHKINNLYVISQKWEKVAKVFNNFLVTIKFQDMTAQCAECLRQINEILQKISRFNATL